MKKFMTEKERKAKKAAYDKARRLAKKENQIAPRTIAPAPASVKVKVPVKAVVTKAPVVKKTVEKIATVGFARKFDIPVRLFWNKAFETKNSSCAKPGTELTFEVIEEKGTDKIYRVRRGKRNFFTNTEELKKSGIDKI